MNNENKEKTAVPDLCSGGVHNPDQALSPEGYEHLLLENQICFALYASANKTIRTYAPYLKRLDITYPQYLVMLVLWERNTTTVGHLQAALNLETGTLSPMLKRMEGRGLITRERDSSDERVVKVNLTQQGRAMRELSSEIPAGLRCTIQYPVPKIVSLREQLKDYLASFKDD
ncbi:MULTISPECIES: MarR family winged helix-turn-helix transcriptional regulator [unclassified Pseudomonas]|uniref:MarR family winged helix-turn-helix transcriptional regulator n=1 Tax=unclassified Pseudomonas TaxID=196821 RepID=UPI0035BF79BA